LDAFSRIINASVMNLHHPKHESLLKALCPRLFWQPN
jgi:hypothetical protein